MSEIQRGTLVPPGEGESVWLVGDLIEVKLASEDTSGAYSMVEETSPPQGGPPPHIHHNVNETLYVVEGEVEVLLGSGTTRASAGSLAYVPKGTLHTFKNIGTSASRVVAIISPGGSRSSSLKRASLPQMDPLRPRASRTWEGLWRLARSTVLKYRHLLLGSSRARRTRPKQPFWPGCGEPRLFSCPQFPGRPLLGISVNRGNPPLG